jgi:hypothetical protein
MKKVIFLVIVLSFVSVLFAQEQVGEMTMSKEEGSKIIKKESYSPYAGRYFPTNVYWGDTHLHTSNSLDARAFGVTLGPEEAYQLARGDEITASHGMRIKPDRSIGLLLLIIPMGLEQ